MTEKDLKSFFATRREASGSHSPGYALLERGGFVRSGGAAGVFSLLPHGFAVHRKLCEIIYEELGHAGIRNLQLPILQSRALWDCSGRWAAYWESKTMFSTIERHRGTEFALAPTAEEMVTAIVAADIQSWRQLPVILHQIGPKFRDEMRPRLGLIRAREFTMSDAYSFDLDEDGMKASYALMCRLYDRIFERMGLDVISVRANSGMIGGEGSAEFMVVSELGEDVLLRCSRCGYAANAEVADATLATPRPIGPERFSHRESTPNARSVAELQALFPEVTADRIMKTIIFTLDAETARERYVAVCTRGDLEINSTKVANACDALTAVPTEERLVARVTGASAAFVGPVNLKGIQLLFDSSVASMRNFICGCNRIGYHLVDANFGRDLPRVNDPPDLYIAQEGMGCPTSGCRGMLQTARGIEVGHVFMLQDLYSDVMEATYRDERGNERPIWMGCYGIGTTRVLQTIAEECRDEKGLVWPARVAPYDVHIVDLGQGGGRSVMSDALEKQLRDRNVSYWYDDRPVNGRVKFNDADLVGAPWRITIGGSSDEAGLVEVRRRATGTTSCAPLQDALAAITTRSVVD